MDSRYLSTLCLIIALKAILIATLIFTGHIGLGPDEAQYWTWSQWLDWGYYSKPPGIAWEIALGTYLFGNTEFGVRSISLLIGSLIPIFIYTTARNCRLSPLQSFLAATALALSPVGILSSFLAITDGGMILFWTASLSYLCNKFDSGKTINYLWLGFLILCGALFKWPIYLLWVAVCLWGYTNRILPGIALSLVALLPSVYWNATHEWSTFRHVSATVSGGHGPAQSGNPLEFLGAQAVLLSPILFVLLLLAFWKLIKKWRETGVGIRFCGLLTGILLLIGEVFSLFTKMQGNWAIFAYPSAFVLLGWSLSEYGKTYRKWFIGGIALSAVLCAILFSLPLPYRINPFRHNIGWDQLTQAIHQSGYNPQADFLFGDKYQMARCTGFFRVRVVPEQHESHSR